jgi:cyclic pyranopterin phosphate synthase
MSPQTAAAVAAGDGPKGEVLGTARLAGIMAAKQTPQLIPLAHPLALSVVNIDASVDVDAGLVELVAEVAVDAKTGVEMEAMVACSVAALTVYDMVKGLERGVTIEQVTLLEKSGGRNDWRLAEDT